MASVGHSLIGLSIAGLAPAPGGSPLLRRVWPGLLVLMAHLIDLIEWAAVILAGGSYDGHFLTHSAGATAIVSLVACATVGMACRCRSPLAWLALATAIFSHLALDAPWAREALADRYGLAHPGGETHSPIAAVPAEAWAYGLLLIGVLLGRELLRRNTGRGARTTGLLLGLMALASAASRSIVIWEPVYAAALGWWLVRKRAALHRGLLWNLLPLSPIGIYVLAILYNGRLANAGWDRQVEGRYAEAIACYDRALRIPTRDSDGWLHVHLGQSYFALGDYGRAEECLRRATRRWPRPNWGEYWLAWFYANSPAGAPQHRRIDQAMRILESILNGPAERPLRETSRRLFDGLRARAADHDGRP
jgi:tetratricopeptide (TPR) repeat protein